jgi:hypothetical protein
MHSGPRIWRDAIRLSAHSSAAQNRLEYKSMPSAACRRSRRRRRRYTGPTLLHIFTFAFAREGLHQRLATILVRGCMDQTAAIGLAGAEAAIRGREPWIIDIRTVPAPRLTPALDAICRRHAAAADFVQLLTAPAGYRPSIRLDLKGGKGFVWPPHMTGRRLNGATSGARP